MKIYLTFIFFFFKLFSLSFRGFSPGSCIAFSCYVSLVSCNVGECLRIFFSLKNLMLLKSTIYSMGCPSIWFFWYFLLIRLRLCYWEGYLRDHMPFLVIAEVYDRRMSITGEVNLALDHWVKMVFAFIL